MARSNPSDPAAARVADPRQRQVQAWPLGTARPRQVAARLVLGAGAVGALLGVGVAVAMRLLVVATPLAVVGAGVCVALACLHLHVEKNRLRAEAARAPHLALDNRALTLVQDGTSTDILRLDRPFGITLLASPARDEVVLALTHRDGVEYIGGRAPSGTRYVDVLARAISTPQNDLPLSERIPIFADGDALLSLAVALESQSAGAFDRVFLSDAGMADVVLEGRRLRAGQLDFDLTSPLRWRAYAFQEGSAIAASTYQATQIRQGDREVVLVALAPSGEIATPSLIALLPTGRVGPLATEPVQGALARDLRLARGLFDLPPARGQRVAIDRLFMPRVRSALDLAPTEIASSRVNTPAPELLTTPPEGMEHVRQSRP